MVLAIRDRKQSCLSFLLKSCFRRCILRSRICCALQDRIFERYIDIITVTTTHILHAYICMITRLSQNFQDHHRIVIHNEGILYSLYNVLIYRHISGIARIALSQAHGFMNPLKVSPPFPVFFFSLFLDASYSKSKPPPTGIRSVDARHRRILAKSVPPILDTLPPFFPISTVRDRARLLLFLLLLLLSSSRSPPSFFLPSHRPPPAIELPFYFRENARAIFSRSRKPASPFSGSWQRPSREPIATQSRTRCNLFLYGREKYIGPNICRRSAKMTLPLRRHWIIFDNRNSRVTPRPFPAGRRKRFSNSVLLNGDDSP